MNPVRDKNILSVDMDNIPLQTQSFHPRRLTSRKCFDGSVALSFSEFHRIIHLVIVGGERFASKHFLSLTE